ncbi:histidine phosphatase family protein [Nonomuraea sp. NPDC046570]|uniref:histidine phosphatase family protein n=1 Tax=Nonomuraea sp. NPDC046570 TaxID=3155255 RepID=UPI0033FFB63B
MVVKLIYEAHSITTDNEAGIATGWLPGELSAAGLVEAAKLGVRRREVEVVYSSDLRRAAQTVEVAFPGREVVWDRRLRECDYGVYNGRPVAELVPLRREYIEVPWPGGGQSYRQVVVETAAFLRDVRARHQGATVLVVAHSANRWALQCLLEGRVLEELMDAPFNWQPGWEYDI